MGFLSTAIHDRSRSCPGDVGTTHPPIIDEDTKEFLAVARQESMEMQDDGMIEESEDEVMPNEGGLRA